MRRDIRETTAGKVGKRSVVLFGGRGDVIVQVRGHRGRLVIGLREIVAEASRASDPGDFGADGLSTAD